MLFMCLWCDFDTCPLLTCLLSSPCAELCLGQPIPWGLDTTLICPATLPDLSISEARAPQRQLSTPLCWVLLSGVPPSSFAYWNWGGASGWLSPAPHPITVPPPGGWAEGLPSKLLALLVGSQLGMMRCCCCCCCCCHHRQPPCALGLLLLLLLLPLGECPGPGCPHTLSTGWV